MKPRKIYACWIYVSDLRKSKQFYQDMGFEIKLIDGDWIESLENNGIEDKKREICSKEEIVEEIVRYYKSYLFN